MLLVVGPFCRHTAKKKNYMVGIDADENEKYRHYWGGEGYEKVDNAAQFIETDNGFVH
jgi:hypothetical protein